MNKPKRPARGALAHGMAIQLALALLSTGKAKTKAEAARIAGVDETSLKPSALQRFALRNPVGRQIAASNPNPDLMAVTVDVGGKMVSAREAFSDGVVSSVRVLARLGPRVGKLTTAQRAHLLDAKRWLEMCRSNGLFAPVSSAPLPQELGSEMADSSPDPDPIPGQIDQFVGDEQSPLEGEAAA